MRNTSAIVLLAGLAVVSGLAGALVPPMLRPALLQVPTDDPAASAKRAAEAAAIAAAAAEAETARLAAREATVSDIAAARAEVDAAQDYLTISRESTAHAAALARELVFAPETFDYVLARGAIFTWDGFDRATRDKLLIMLDTAKADPARRATLLAEIKSAFGG